MHVASPRLDRSLAKLSHSRLMAEGQLQMLSSQELVQITEERDVYQLSGTLLLFVAAVLVAFLNPCTWSSNGLLIAR
jgi:hypothetical protein